MDKSMPGAVPPKEVVELELVNQRLTELTQGLQMTEQQLEHSSLALSVLKELANTTDNQEILVPVGNGVFFTVNQSSIRDIKVAVGAGVVVDKSNADALAFVRKQFDELQSYYSQLITSYELTVQKANQLQEQIESGYKNK